MRHANHCTLPKDGVPMTFSRMSHIIVLLAALAFSPFVVRAQPAVQRPAAAAARPCCKITSIDLRTGHIAAQVVESKRAFAFIVTDRAKLIKLRAGQPIFATFKANRVFVEGLGPVDGFGPVDGYGPVDGIGPVDGLAPPNGKPGLAPPPPAKAESKPTKPSTAGSFDLMKVDVSTATPTEDTAATTAAIRGRYSADSENARGETDRHSIVAKGRSFGSIVPHSLGRSERLKDDPAIGEYVKLAVWALKGFEVKMSLLAGHKYMISDCLGVKVSAGEFAMTIPDPDLRVVNDGMVLTFAIPHVAMNAFSVRLRPDVTDAIEPCHFSGAVGIAGSADDLRYEMHFDPTLDLEQCKIGSMGQMHQVWRVGTVRLEPLPPAVTSAASDMIGDALTAFANFDVTDRIVATLNAAADTQCHK